MTNPQQTLAFNSLSDILDVKPIYILPKDKNQLIDKLFVPALKSALRYDCMTAFFHPSALKQLAYGLTSFINNKPSTMRLLISPYLNDEVKDAINCGYSESKESIAKYLENIYGEILINENSLIKHTMQCLSYLIAEDRLRIKFVFVKEEGEFHPKTYIFDDTSNQLVVSGSNNYTSRGFLKNIEHTQVSKSWGSEENKQVVKELIQNFDEFWNNKETDLTYTYEFKEAFDKRLIRDYPAATPPTSIEFDEALNSDVGDYKLETEQNLIVPDYINYTDGTYSFQGEAVTKWKNNQYSGILAMATGSGKTITSLIAASKLAEETESLLIVVAAPYIPLVEQWADEVRKFALEPVELYKFGKNAKDKIKEIRRLIRLLDNKQSKLKVIIITNHLLKDEDFLLSLSKMKSEIMLIADEVHHLGTDTFIDSPPDFITYRLGLSATPKDQFDDERSDKLLNYFNGIVYEFSMEDAISKGCLVNYNYYVYPVYLTEDENEKFIGLSKKIQYLLFGKKDDVYIDAPKSKSSELDGLLYKRRRLVEQAKNKFIKLDSIFQDVDVKSLQYTLIYCSDKFHEQLDHVNNLMKELRINFHQVTSDETKDKEKLKTILDDFGTGNSKQVLTSMRVLDEGVNIPQITTAYILASTTIKRQWVQRRGRVLRTCDKTNKRRAHVHDFLVLPTTRDNFTEGLIKSEVNRIKEFGKLSLNFNASNGAFHIIDGLLPE